MARAEEETSIGHKIAIGIWHFVCTFITLSLVCLFWGSPVSIQLTIGAVSAFGLISFVLGYCEIQDPIMLFYSSAFKLIR